MWQKVKSVAQAACPVWVITPAVAVTVVVGNVLGGFDLLEWSIRDEFFRQRPTEAKEERIIVVTIELRNKK